MGSATWPDGPLQSGVAEVSSDSVSGVGDAVVDEKKRGNGVEEKLNEDMTNDEMTCETHKQIVKPLSQTFDDIWRTSVRSENKCPTGHTDRPSTENRHGRDFAGYC